MILRRVREWIRVIAPAHYLLPVVFLCAVILIGLSVFEDGVGARRELASTLAILELLACFATVAYVAIRVLYFHPAENRPYGVWLANTPWHYPQRLPLGPVTLVWQDAFVVALLTAFQAIAYFPLPVVPTLFLTLYCLAHASFLCRIGIYWTAYVSSFLLGCIFLAFPLPWIMLAFAGLMYAAIFIGLQRMLIQFPFGDEERKVYLATEKGRLQPLALLAGWPLPPKRVELRRWRISPLNSALVGATTAWLFFCIGFHAQSVPGFAEGMQKGLGTIVMAAVVLRILIYIIGFVPPISFWGRLATGRLIIPGYDVVLAAPLAVVAIAWLMTAVAHHLGIAPIAAIPVIAGIAVWLTLALLPRREAWQLTGHHRIAYRFRAAFTEQANASKRIR